MPNSKDIPARGSLGCAFVLQCLLSMMNSPSNLMTWNTAAEPGCVADQDEDVHASLEDIARAPAGQATIALEVVAGAAMLPFLYIEVASAIEYGRSWFDIQNLIDACTYVNQVRCPADSALVGSTLSPGTAEAPPLCAARQSGTPDAELWPEGVLLGMQHSIRVAQAFRKIVAATFRQPRVSLQIFWGDENWVLAGSRIVQSQEQYCYQNGAPGPSCLALSILLQSAWCGGRW